MIQLTSRQQSVLTLLLSQKAPLAVKKIAERYALSERTIRYDLEQIKAFVKLRGGVLTKCPGVGVTVEADEALRLELGADTVALGGSVRILSKEDRCTLIFRKLLLSDAALTVDELAALLQVSRTTVTSDMQQVATQLKAVKLVLRGKKGEGFRLDGLENDLRICIVNTLESLIPPHYAFHRNALSNSLLRSISEQDSPVATAAQYLCGADIDTLIRLLVSAREIIAYQLHSTEQLRFILYLAVLVIRIQAGHTAKEHTAEEAVDMDSRENQLAQLIAGRISMWFRITLNDREVRLLSVWLITCNVKFAPKANDKIIQELSEIVDDMLLVLQDFPSYDLPDFYRDKLKMNLVSHLKLTIKKYNLQIAALNTLLTQMKVNYPEMFTVSYRMAERFERRTGIALGEDEIGFIAIHLAASMEECSRLRSKKALIVCNTGRGAAMVLYNRICSNIPRLEILGTISALDAVEGDALERIDFVISTIDLPDINKPVFRVSPIITAAEMANISSYINGNLPSGNLEHRTDTMTKSTVGSYEESAVLRCAMILAKLGSIAGELEQLYGVQLSYDKVFGLAIHLMMSIPRWEKGIYSRELPGDRYKEEHIDMYNLIAKLLREASKECGITIPDKEALSIMRYFV